jgi:hypothetical protein
VLQAGDGLLHKAIDDAAPPGVMTQFEVDGSRIEQITQDLQYSRCQVDEAELSALITLNKPHEEAEGNNLDYVMR